MDKVDEELYDDSDMFTLTPELAHMMASLSTDELINLYGEEALLIARFIQGRERREMDLPTQEEIVKIVEHYHKMITDQHLFGLTLKGFAYIDWDGNEPVWSITAEGAEAVQGTQ